MADQATDTASAALLTKRLQELALHHHQRTDGKGEGEYGCPGLECPGVQRLVAFARECVDAALASLPAPATDTARLLKDAQAVLDLDGDPRVTPMEAMLRAGGIIRRLMSALEAQGPRRHRAPHEPLYGFPGSSTKLASLPAPAAPEEENTRLREALGGTSERVGIAGFIRRMMPYLPDQFWKDSAEEMAQLCERSLRPQEPR